MKKIFRRILFIGIICFIVGTLTIFSMNLTIINKSKSSIKTVEKLNGKFDCILILGAGIKIDGTPSNMLEDRLLQGLELYEAGFSSKILVSGDNGTEHHDEVNPMKEFLIGKGVPPEDIFMDHAGFETYDSIYRTKHIFGAKKVIIVTQKYHLYRALYLADKLNLKAYGVSSDLRSYENQEYREVREVLARVKAYGNGILKPDPKYMGDTIPLIGDGNVTND